MMALVAGLMDHLRSRYKTFGIIGFGDLNTDFVAKECPCKKVARWRDYCGFKLHYSREIGAHTRFQGGKASYLDYLFSAGVSLKELAILGRFGSSDHLVVKGVFDEFSPVIRGLIKFFSKTRAKKLLEDIIAHPERWGISFQLPALEFFKALSDRLREHSIVYEPRAKSYFHTIRIVETELGKREVDWKKIRRAILACRRTEFLALLERSNAHRKTGMGGVPSYHSGCSSSEEDLEFS